jgi:hypothetical protein
VKQKIPIACCLTVFTKEQRSVYKDTWAELTKGRLGIKETDNGYEYRFTDESDTLRLLFEWISMERQCCPFLTFTVNISKEGEPINRNQKNRIRLIARGREAAADAGLGALTGCWEAGCCSPFGLLVQYG